jgi:outer membrane protein assembly factor BamB
MRTRIAIACLFASLTLIVRSTTSRADDWPQWRGANANGVAAPGAYPVKFSADEGIGWKVALPGLGMSTPAVWGEQIFVTCGIDGQDGVVAYDFAGQELWRKTLGPERAGRNQNASGANPSPATDGKHLVVYYKSGALACLDLAGNVTWQKNLQQEYGKDTLWWDLSTSPVIVGDRVVIAVMQEGTSYLAAFALKDGEVVWKESRQYTRPRESDQAYTTPLVAQLDGRDAIITFGADHLTSNDAATGKLLWDKGDDLSFNPRDQGMWRVIASPVIDGDILIAPFGRGSLLSGEKLSAAGAERLWENAGRGAAPECPTPAAQEGRAYLLMDTGNVKCLEVATGKEVWSGALPRNRAKYYASPVLAGGRLYCPREDGKLFVVAAADKFELLAENDMGEKLIASPVPVRNGLLVRGAENLFWIPAGTETASVVR